MAITHQSDIAGLIVGSGLVGTQAQTSGVRVHLVQ